MGQQSLKLLFTGNSLNDSKKGINTMAKKDTYDAGSISVLKDWKLSGNVRECTSEAYPGKA